MKIIQRNEIQWNILTIQNKILLLFFFFSLIKIKFFFN